MDVAVATIGGAGDLVRMAGALVWLLLPGLALILRLRPGLARDLASLLALSIACGAALALAVATGLALAGASFDALFVSLWLLFAAASVSLVKGGAWPAALRRTHVGLAAGAVIAFGVGLVTTHPIGVATDAIDHIATVRAVINRGELEPNTVFYAGGDGACPDARKGPGHAVAAALTRTSGLDPVRAWYALRPFAFAGAFVAFGLFARVLVGGGVGLGIALLGFPLLVHGNATWFLDTIAYPHNLDWLLIWPALALAVDGIVTPSWRTHGLVALLAAFAGALHVFAPVLLVAGIAAVAFACLLLGPREGRAPALRTLVIGALAAAPIVGLRLALTHHPVNPLHVEASEILYLTAFLQLHSPAPMMHRFSLSALLLAFGALLLLRRRLPIPHAALAGLALAPLLVSLNPVMGGLLIPRIGYLFVRFLGLVPYPVVAAALILTAAGLTGVRRWTLGIVVTALLLTRVPAFVSFLGAAPGGPTPEAWDAGFRLVRTHVPPGTTVLSDPLTSYTLPAYTGRRVVTALDQHSSPSDSTILQRTDAVVRALSPYRPVREAVRACERYGAEFVLLNAFDGRRVESFFDVRSPKLVRGERERFDAALPFRRVDAAEGFVLYAYTPGDTTAVEPAPAKLPWRVTPSPSAIPVELWTNVDLYDVSFEPAAPAPGDTLRVTIVLRKTAPDRPATPYRLVLRLRHDLAGEDERLASFDRLYARAVHAGGGPRLEVAVNRRPLDGLYPLGIWDVGETIADTLQVVLPGDLESGIYRVGLRLRPQRLIRNIALADWLRPSGGIGTPVGTVTVVPR